MYYDDFLSKKGPDRKLSFLRKKERTVAVVTLRNVYHLQIVEQKERTIEVQHPVIGRGGD